MNARTRRAALYAIGVIAVAASINALTTVTPACTTGPSSTAWPGRQAMSWPAEIELFLAIGELVLDAWPARQRVWPWATALIGAVGERGGEHRPRPARTRSSWPTG